MHAHTWLMQSAFTIHKMLMTFQIWMWLLFLMGYYTVGYSYLVWIIFLVFLEEKKYSFNLKIKMCSLKQKTKWRATQWKLFFSFYVLLQPWVSFHLCLASKMFSKMDVVISSERKLCQQRQNINYGQVVNHRGPQCKYFIF